MIGEFKPYAEEPRCGVRRWHTNATCEMPPGHDDEGGHCGRDSLGRWHSWSTFAWHPD